MDNLYNDKVTFTEINDIKNKIKVKFDAMNLRIDDLLYNKILDKIAYYVKGISSITDGMITEDYLIYELSKIDIIRVGDLDKVKDGNLIYMGKPLLDRVNRIDRPKSLFTYALSNNEFVSVIAFFTPKEIFSMGNMVNLPGMDFDNDLELTKELYLCLTKYLSTTIIKHQNLNKLTFEGVEYQDGINVSNRVVLNGITNKKEDYYEGLTTYEFNQKNNEIITHDFLSNLMNEYITNLVLKFKGEPVDNKENIITRLSDKYNKEIFITKYLINARKLLKEMERINIEDLNLVHYIELNHNQDGFEEVFSNYINVGAFIRPITKEQCLEFYSKYIK